MSTDVRGKAKETAKSVRDLLIEVQKSTHARLSKEAPKVMNSLDDTFDKASKGMADALKSIDKATTKEQGELLKAYRSFLQKQTEIVDKRLASKKSDSQTET